jgi:hypothetical protein
MKKGYYALLFFVVSNVVLSLSTAPAQEKKLERIRVGGGPASATQMAMWLAARNSPGG